MYSFEGQYKRAPVQSLGGSSKNEELGSLINRTQENRRRREEAKLRLSSAIKIQSCFRSWKIRQRMKLHYREQFDSDWRSDIGSKSNISALTTFCRQLIFFYEERLDHERLISLCQIIIKQKGTSFSHFYQNQAHFHQLKHLLLICGRHLEAIAGGSQPPAIALRMLETFTNLTTFRTHMKKQPKAENMFYNLLLFLVSRRYFHFMRVLLEAKVPGDIEKSVSAPTPLASSIMELVLNPITSFEGSPHPAKSIVLRALCSEMLCQPFSPQFHKFFLPFMANGSTRFPIIDLLHALVPMDQAEMSVTHTEWQLTVEPSIWLLSSILTLSESQLDRTSDEEFKLYMLILHRLVPTLRSAHTRLADELSDDDEEESMDFTEAGHATGLDEVQRECLQSLDKPTHVVKVVAAVGHNPSPDLLIAISTVCYALIVQNKMFVHNTRLLYSLAFNPVFVRNLWHTCRTVTAPTATRSDMNLLQVVSSGLPMKEEHFDKIVPLLFLFCSLFSHSLHSLHDSDFFREDPECKSMQPFSVEELTHMSVTLRDACLGIVSLAHPESRPNLGEGYRKTFPSVAGPQSSDDKTSTLKHRETLAYLFRVMSLLVKQLYARDSRRPFCPAGSWLSPYIKIEAQKLEQLYKARETIFARRPFGSLSVLNPNREEDEGPSLSNTEVKKLTILTELPFVVPFAERVKIFHRLVHSERIEHQGEMRHLHGGKQINILVRRNYLYEDAFEKLSPDNEPDLKLRMQVQLVNFAGLDEAGIDGGGIFREFMNELLKTSFDPNRGFFKHTIDQLLYPNPQARLIVETFTKHYYFLGRILGKVIYENMLVELPFANFFLSKILSRHRGDVDINHLASLDPEMYKNLLFLKTYEGDVSDLGLDFTVVNNDLGETHVEELKPGGKDLLVNNMNRIEYIHLMADYRLNRQMRTHCAAFRQGLADVVNIDWLRMFDHNELQVLISGAHIPIDIEDLKQHTNYSGPFNADHQSIKNFWLVVEEFNDVQKRQLLKFVTSCSRPPLLGFKEMYPAFCVHYAGSEDRLPTASTCMNLLKLPDYPDRETLKQKLLYAIESASGFELS